MLDMQDTKLVGITPPAALVNNGAVTCATLDTLGYDYAQIIAYLGATDIALTVLKVQESDDSGMSGAADVTGLVFGTSSDVAGSTSSLPSATDDNKFSVFDIDLRNRKRYLKLCVTVGAGSTGAYVAALAVLSRAKIAPVSAANRGAGDVLRV